MHNEELKKILSEITDHANKGMAANLTVKAIRDTIARYPHDPVELTIIKALLNRLEVQVTEFSSIWWRIREIEKLEKTEATDSTNKPAVAIADFDEGVFIDPEDMEALE